MVEPPFVSSIISMPVDPDVPIRSPSSEIKQPDNSISDIQMEEDIYNRQKVDLPKRKNSSILSTLLRFIYKGSDQK